jgi:PTH2 family peptidyl-tRNA hydrolase
MTKRRDTTEKEMMIFLTSGAFVAGVLATILFSKLFNKRTNVSNEKQLLQDEEEEESEITDLSDFHDDDDDDDDRERKKLVLVVREDLKMTSGKIAAQCSHATLGIYRKIIHQHKRKKSELTSRNIQWLKHWDVSGCAKVALKVKTLKEMNKIMEQVKQAQLPYHTVIDAGKTQIAANSVTVLAIGPAPESMVNQFTGHLKLL